MERKIINRILTISGDPASGKSTVIKELVKKYEEQGYKVHLYSVGAMFRKIAEEKGLSIEQLNEYMRNNENIDKIIDKKVEQYGKEINSEERPDEIFIFDSRLAWSNIPDSFSVRLTVDSDIAGKRAFEDKKRGKEDRYDTLEEAIQSTKNRKKEEIERYKEIYGVDIGNPSNYQLIIDTSYISIAEAANQIVYNEKQYADQVMFDEDIILDTIEDDEAR